MIAPRAIVSQKGRPMRIYIFKSEQRNELHAFASDLMGSKLPSQHGPWTATGVVGIGAAPPHNISRDAVEKAIAAEGFQLWRMKKEKADAA
jgi:hypothetical protein